MAKTKRQQTAEAESQYNTRQDRNTFFTAGGLWTWDAGTGTISWTADANIQRGSLAEDTITGPDSVAGLTATNDILYAHVDRSTGGTTLTAGVEVDKEAGTAGLTDSDDLVVLAVRSSDGKLYFRNGTVFSDGEVKAFGTVKSATDRVEVVADGAALQTVGFDYLLASNQLAVYVGGVLQVLSVHYTETTASPGDITFEAGHIPSQGERITFIDILGGQGPSGSSQVSLQDAWSNGHDIDVTTGNELYLFDTGAGAYVLSGGDAAYSGGRNWGVTPAGDYLSSSGISGYAFLDDAGGSDDWHFRPLDTGVGDAIFAHWEGAGPHPGFRIDSAGLMEWGEYTGGAYPFAGGTWSGGGGIRWTVYSGTTASGAQTTLAATGLSDVLGIVFSVVEVGTNHILWESNSPQVGANQFAITFDSATGDITLSQKTDGTLNPGSNIQGVAYQMVVFHQG
jgi:hypothetical protein